MLVSQILQFTSGRLGVGRAESMPFHRVKRKLTIYSSWGREVPEERIAFAKARQNLSTQAETKTIAQVFDWKTVINGVRILAVEINGTEKKKGEKFKMIGVHDSNAADRILEYGESLQDGQDTFFMVCNVHGIVKVGVETDVNTLPAIKGTDIWNENGNQEPIDIAFMSDQEGEALWNKVRRA